VGGHYLILGVGKAIEAKAHNEQDESHNKEGAKGNNLDEDGKVSFPSDEDF